MKYDFDKVIDRNGTAAVKLEEANVKCWVIRGNLTVTIGQSLIG